MEVRMNDEFADLWQGQSTTGLPIAVEELRGRVDRLKSRMNRHRRIGAAAILLTLAMGAGGLIFFEESIAAWFRAATYLLWVIYIVFAPEFFRKKPADSESGVLTMKMPDGSTPCLEFYRNELEARLEYLRQGRVFSPILIVSAVMFGLFATRLIPGRTNPWPAAVAGTIATVLAIGWYIRIRRESPRIQSELEDIAALDLRTPSAGRG
jgi:hypothetical protein